MIYKIIAPENALYMSEFIKELPKGILNKKACNVGGSFIALTNEENYIIAVPTTELIKNKISQHKNILGIYSIEDSKITFNKFRKYIEENNIKKIMTTYDSLPRTIKWLEKLNINPYTEFKLLVDEYHKILTDYSYRNKAIDTLLQNSLKFEYYTFLSATPINPTFIPKELKDLPYYEIEWSSVKQVKPYRKKTTKPLLHAVNIIKQYKSNNYSAELKINNEIHISNEAYFFVNSVKVITDIINSAELLPSEVKIICADTDRNRDMLDPYSISSVNDPNKPFTFITSKSFLGCDFYSDSGIVYVISNVNKKNTLLDIGTDIFQISGRIRNTNNPFKNILFHIYNTGSSDLTEEEFKLSVKEKIENTNRQIRIFNSLNDLDKKATLKRYELDLEDDYSFYNSDTNKLEFNELKMLNEEFSFNIVNEIYSNGLSIREAYLKAGFDVSEKQEFINYEEEFITKMTKITFRDILEEYCKLIDEDENLGRQKALEKLEPEIKHMVEKLGTKRIRTLTYNKTAINKELYRNCNEVNEALKKRLEIQLVKNKFYSLMEIKNILQKNYDDLKLNKKAKSTDVKKYFERTKNASRTVDSKKVKGFFIV